MSSVCQTRDVIWHSLRPKEGGHVHMQLKSQKTVAPLTFGDLSGTDLGSCTQYLVVGSGAGTESGHPES